MRDRIIKELKRIENDEKVKIIYAVESGSRAWGFPSKDSDYDVRFIYLRNIEWYISVDEKRDVLEFPINDELDISGWDLKKSLELFTKTNPSLYEWLNSPIIYWKEYSIIDKLIDLSKTYFSPKSSMSHYLSMATSNNRHYLQGKEIKIKKYFYVLRPILACKWIEIYNSHPPIEFEKLINSLINDNELRYEIEKLLERKKKGDELDIEERIDIISNFIETEIKYYKSYVAKMKKSKRIDYEVLNNVFKNAFSEVWDMNYFS